MLRYAFIVIILGVALPLALTSALSDMNKRKFAGLATAMLTCCILIAMLRTPVSAEAQAWLAEGSRPPALGALVMALIVIVAVAGPFLRRRTAFTLDWPRSTSQGQFQKLGASYLASRAWQIEPLDSFAGISIYRCRKDKLRMFVLFVRQQITFERLLKNISRTPGLNLRNVIVVYFDDPPVRLVDAFLQSTIRVIGYRHLDSVDSICLHVEEERLEIRRKEIALRVSGVSG